MVFGLVIDLIGCFNVYMLIRSYLRQRRAKAANATAPLPAPSEVAAVSVETGAIPVVTSPSPEPDATERAHLRSDAEALGAEGSPVAQPRGYGATTEAGDSAAAAASAAPSDSTTAFQAQGAALQAMPSPPTSRICAIWHKIDWLWLKRCAL